MAYDVKFLKGTLANFEAQKTAATLDKNTFYYIDETDLYLGDILLSSDDDVKAAVARIKVNEDEIADIKAELDALVDPDGSGAGSITSQISALRNELTRMIDDNYELITKETTRAQEAEKGLQNTVNALDLRIEANETNITQLDTDLDALTTKVGLNSNAISVVQDDIADVKVDVKNLQDTTASHTTTLNTLVGQDTNQSVRSIAIDELAKQLIPENAQEAMDTLEEIAAWLQSHPNDVGEINKQINLNTTNIDNLLETTEDHTERIVSLEEVVADINDTETGILATAKAYTDAEIDKVELVLDDLTELTSDHTEAIEAINNTTTGILATANANIQAAIDNLGLGSAAYKNVSDFDAAGSAAAALNEAKAYTDTALTWGEIKVN